MENKITIKPPKGEVIWPTYVLNNIPKYIVTTKEDDRKFYFLYEIKNGEPVKIKRSVDPTDFESFYIKELVN